MESDAAPSRRRHLHDPRHGRGIYHSFRTDGTRVFEVRVEDGNGKRRFEVVGPNLAQAKAQLAELQVTVSKGGKLPSLSMTVGDLANEWWTLKGEAFKPRTQDAYHLQIRKVTERFGQTKVRNVSGTDLAVWLRSTKGKETLWAVLRQMFAYGARQGYVTVSPCDMVEPSDRPRKKPADRFKGRVYSDEEIARLCAVAGRWLQEVIIVGRYTGMRLGEILALDHEVIDFENKQIRVVGTVGLDRSIGTTKSGKERVVPMLSAAEKVLRDKRRVSGPIFRTNSVIAAR
jgi:integrase